ncbi:MAG: IS30 family transposase, partial [Noviherbaspirillum sp.]
ALRVPRARVNQRRDGFVAEEVMISARPAEVEDRAVPGHWEGDLILGIDRSAIGTLVERTSRFVLLAQMADCSSRSALHGFARVLRQVAPALRKTMTDDRGSEMARHRELAERAGIKVYFADPYSPWQRGSNENANDLLRAYLPKGSDLAAVTQAQLNAIANTLNDRPRRILDYQTPREVFVQLPALEQAKFHSDQQP